MSMASTTSSTRKSPDNDVTPQAPQSTPSMGGGGDYSPFVWQQLSDIQKTLGAMTAKLDQNTQAFEKLDESLGKVKADVAEFKQIRHTAKVVAWIVGVTMAGVLAVTGFIAKEAWSLLKPMAVEKIQTPADSAKK